MSVPFRIQKYIEQHAAAWEEEEQLRLEREQMQALYVAQINRDCAEEAAAHQKWKDENNQTERNADVLAFRSYLRSTKFSDGTPTDDELRATGAPSEQTRFKWRALGTVRSPPLPAT